jgi:arabinoxylan arabinofuranohydrolase
MKRNNRITVLVFSIIVLTLSANTVFADYPLLDTITYSADPSCLEYNGVLYSYWSNDDNNSGSYSMHQITCLSTTDLKNWTNNGQVFDVPTDCSWAKYSWAPAVVYRDGYFWMYFGNNATNIGVAKSASPTGPFKDAKGSAIVDGNTPGATGLQWCFDPGVLVDDDGQAYLYWGGGSNNQNARVIKLNNDMISVNGSAVSIPAPNHFEDSWIHKYNGKYYYSYSINPGNGQKINYMMSDNPMTGWADKGTLMNNLPDNSGNNNHHSIFQYKGSWYIGYHNRYVAIQQGIDTTYKRNACMDQLFYNTDGTIQLVTNTKDGLPLLTGTAVPTAVPTTAPTAAPACSLKGDVNGSGVIDIVDALLVAQAYVGLNPSNYNALCADVNCSGAVDIVDALLIAQRYVGLISSFPC